MPRLSLLLVALAGADAASSVCSSNGITTCDDNSCSTTTSDGYTLNCISVGGELYDIFPIENGITTCGANDDNSCPDGTDIWVPRTYDHAKAVWDEYGGDGGDWWSSSGSYIGFVGIYRPASGGATYDECCEDSWSQAMNSDDMASYTGVGWTSVAAIPEPWYMRSTAYSEPNGDYDAYCWLDIWNFHDHEGFEFNDESCGVCSDTYLCSTNEWESQPPTASPAPTVSAVPTPSACCPEEFTDCGTFCDYNSDCVGDNWCGDGSWNLCGDDYNYDESWHCIICSFEKSWYNDHSCPPGYNDCGWGCDLDDDCSAYNEHTGHDNEQYSGLAQVAYPCDRLPDDYDNYYYGEHDDGYGDDCSQEWCTSDDGNGGHDCWAGSEHEACTCQYGEAKVIYDDGGEYVMYTCCTDGQGTDGEECNDCCTDVGLIIVIIITSVVGFIIIATCVGIAICYFAKCACFAQPPTPGFQPQQPGVQMQQVPMAQARAMPMQQGVILGQQPTGVIQQPQAQPGPILTGTVVSAAPPTKSNIAL